MTADEVVEHLRTLGKDSYRKVLPNKVPAAQDYINKVRQRGATGLTRRRAPAPGCRVTARRRPRAAPARQAAMR
jgi:hypothetical protein